MSDSVVVIQNEGGSFQFRYKAIIFRNEELLE